MNYSEFESKAREHQAEYIKRWGEGIDCYTTSDPEYKSTNPAKRVWLTMPEARKGLVFYEGFRDEVLGLPEISRRLGNKQDFLLMIALRSEHIPYNLFFPLIKNKDKAATRTVISRLCGVHDIVDINDIAIEYAPKPRARYLNDGTAFDVFVDYTDSLGRRCGIGIEVKYTEREYTVDPSAKEWQDTHDIYGRAMLGSPYKEVTAKSGFYKDHVEELLVTDYLRQIWRNHMLGASMMQNGELASFRSVILFPDANPHFHDAGAVYRTLLTDEGVASFSTATYEEYIGILRDLWSDDPAWIDYLQQRYIL